MDLSPEFIVRQVSCTECNLLARLHEQSVNDETIAIQATDNCYTAAGRLQQLRPIRGRAEAVQRLHVTIPPGHRMTSPRRPRQMAPRTNGSEPEAVGN